jgi:ArsR family transcriptional regulator
MINNIYKIQYIVRMMIVQDYTSFKERAELLKTLGHPMRMCIVSGLLGKECNVSKMQECLEVPQPIVSQHLAVLKKKGIIKGVRKGTEIVYYVADERVKKIIEALCQEE